MQQQKICESDRFAPHANCRDQRSRLKEAKRILERYVIHNNTIHLVDEAQYWFKILSMMTPTLWYNVLLQCSCYDCQDLASKCKHLLRLQIIIERHMPSLCGSLPFIDHAAQVRMDDITETKMEIEAELAIKIEVEAVDMESRKSQL